jgi:GTPase
MPQNLSFTNTSPYISEQHIMDFNILKLIILFYLSLILMLHCFISCSQELCEFQIDETFRVPEVGTIVGGLLAKGVITEGAKLVIGNS